MVDYVDVKFGKNSFIGFSEIVLKTDRQTERQTQTPLNNIPTQLPCRHEKKHVLDRCLTCDRIARQSCWCDSVLRDLAEVATVSDGTRRATGKEFQTTELDSAKVQRV